MSDAPFAQTYPRPISDEKTLPIVIYVLNLLGFVTGGLTAVAGLIVAYASQGGAGPLARSHFRFQTRTFWFALAWLVIGSFIFLLGFPLLLALGLGVLFFLTAKLIFAVTAVWWGVRNVVGLIRAAQDEPYPTPESWLL